MSNAIELGHIRIANRHVIQLKSYDPYPDTGAKTYRINSDQLWFPHINYKIGQWVTFYDVTPNYYNGAWDAATNTPTLSNSDGLLANTYYIVAKKGIVNFGSGSILFDQGDLVVYNGTNWDKLIGSQFSYICKEEHWAGSTFDESKWIKNDFPSFYRLDISTGVLHAEIDYMPIYSRLYEFYVRIDKKDRLTGQIEFKNQLFKLKIKGPIDNDLTFITPLNLGFINQGYVSELSILAIHENQQIGYTVELISGQLPEGLGLLADGTLFGRVSYTATLGTYSFRVKASDQYGQNIENDFTLEVRKYDDNKYTQIFVKPFLKRAERNLYLQFISDTNIFQQEFLYRPGDPNFGIQYDIRLYLEYGIQQANLSDYVEPLKNYFYRKKLWFGAVDFSKATDTNGNYVYDVVYVNIVDSLVRTLPFQIDSSGNSFPNSIEHMKNSLENMIIGGNVAAVDEFLKPLWLRSVQEDSGVPIGYKPVVVLCYCKPGTATEIIKNINQSGFNFNTINFEIDRLIVENNLTIGENLPYDNSIIITNNGSIIYSKYNTHQNSNSYLIFP